jgi:3-oxoacyl-[acyl-carrier-protein] synthase-3
MPPDSAMRACAHSFAMYVPPRCVTNQELSTVMDTSDEWITQRSGIKTRYWVDAPTTTSDLAVASARQTLRGTSLEAVDAVIAATLSPDFSFPGIGVSVQHKLGLSKVPAFDVRNQCSGFLYSLELAESLVLSGKYRNVLVVGAEVHSTGLDISTRGRDLAVLFGDGAGSCLVSMSEASNHEGSLEILGSELHSDGAHVKELWCEHPGSAHFPTRVTEDLFFEGRLFPHMNGRKVFESAVRSMTEVSLSLLKRLGISTSEVSLFIPHQANLRINAAVAGHLGLKDEQVVSTIQTFGNTTAATIPIGITKAYETGRIQPGQVILSAAFGGGFTWGATAFRAR